MAFETPADYYRFFANESRKGGSPLYESLSLRIAESEHIQKLAAGKRPGQPPANLIFGAVQLSLALGRSARAQGLLSGGRRNARPADARAWDLFVDFCDRYEKDIVPIVNERVTNTNEVGRSALLAPAFEIVAKEAGAPLGLVEIGPSAGLNSISSTAISIRMKPATAAGARPECRLHPEVHAQRTGRSRARSFSACCRLAHRARAFADRRYA
ncbi:MAG: DUF2332 family protein [Alphaproteobacteria bacterium]